MYSWFFPFEDDTGFSGYRSEVLWNGRYYKNKSKRVQIYACLLSCAVVKEHCVGGP